MNNQAHSIIALGLCFLALSPATVPAAETNLEAAVKAAYEAGKKAGYDSGYTKGFADGKNAGTIGEIPGGFSLVTNPKRPGGSTSGHEAAPFYRYSGSTKAWSFKQNNDPIIQAISAEDLGNRLEAQNQTEGLVIIESVPLHDMKKLQQLMKEIGGKQLSVKPKAVEINNATAKP